MATWTSIPDSVLEPGKPVRSVDALALRDNAIAIAQGAEGAPRVQTNGINNSAVTTAKINNSAVTTDKINNSAVTTAKIANSNVTAAKLATGGGENNWVRARTATSAVGAVGTYAFLSSSGSSVNNAPGDTRPGALLQYSNAGGGSSGVPSGTWRCMGRTDGGSTGEPASLWLRIS